MQNKLHYAAHGHTAAEVISERANAEKPFMGLTSFKGEVPTLKDVGVAKNYLNENELKILNNLVSGYFDLAEITTLANIPSRDVLLAQLLGMLTNPMRSLAVAVSEIAKKNA